ncbi:MAG: hypothetical protein D6791_08590 [Chloroflexi bacterium]|nr:MAG: hypothetical protein D6791_08590 [Chloroflexota bacterium]
MADLLAVLFLVAIIAADIYLFRDGKVISWLKGELPGSVEYVQSMVLRELHAFKVQFPALFDLGRFFGSLS